MSHTNITRWIRVTGLMALLAVVAVGIGYAIPVHAAPLPVVPGNGVTTAGNLGTVLKSTLVQIATVNTFLHIALLIILQFLQYLLQADFFNDATMMSGLYTIWQLSRDIMNILFAVMLIGVSFYVIVTAKSDMIKDKLMSFVTAVVLVNFSWFFPRVILDVANILASTVYSVPNMLPAPLNACTTLNGAANPVPTACQVVTAFDLFTPKNQAAAWCAANLTPGGTSVCKCIDDLECHVLTDYNTAIATMKSSHAIINGLAVSFARITQLATIPQAVAGPGPIGNGQAVQISVQLAMSILMAFIIQIATVLPLVGLAIGLFIRIIILWVTTAFMPFAFLGVVVNGKLGTNVFEFETDIWKEFLNAAFLPAVVGVPMVIGFIMLSTVSTVPMPAGNFTFTVPLLNGVGSWWSMLWMFAAVGILWTGSFKALSKSKITEKFTSKVQGFGEGIFKAAVQLPLLTPIPLPGGKTTSAGQVLNKVKSIGPAIGASARTGKSFGQTLQQISGSGPTAGTAPPPNLDVIANNARADTQKIVDAIGKLQSNNAADRTQAVQVIQNVTGTHGTEKEAFEALKNTIQQKLTGTQLDNQAIKDILDQEIRNHP